MKRILAVVTLATGVVFGTPHAAWPTHHGSHVVVQPGQPAPRVGSSYLYPDPETTPGVTDPQVTQANIQQTICASGWTDTIRPAPSYTDNLKKQQLQAARYKDKTPACTGGAGARGREREDQPRGWSGGAGGREG